MVFNCQNHVSTSPHLGNTQIEKINKFTYFGCFITTHLDPDTELKYKIECARIFNKMTQFLCKDNLNLKLRQRMVKYYVIDFTVWHSGVSSQDRHNELLEDLRCVAV